MATFTDDPLPNETLAISQPKIRDNNTFFKDYVGKDHNFAATSNTALNNPFGYHTVIHYLTQTTPPFDPVAIPGVVQTYTKIAANPPEAELFARLGGGAILQMTGDSPLENGYVWCAGLLFQWGWVSNSGSGSGILTFPIAYVNQCLTVQATLTYLTNTPGGTGTVAIRRNVPGTTSPKKTGFDWKVITSSSEYNGFFWFAQGY